MKKIFEKALMWGFEKIISVLSVYMGTARDIAQVIDPGHVEATAIAIWIAMLFASWCVLYKALDIFVEYFTETHHREFLRYILSLVIVVAKGWSFRRAWNALGDDVGQQCHPDTTTLDFPNVDGGYVPCNSKDGVSSQ